MLSPDLWCGRTLVDVELARDLCDFLATTGDPRASAASAGHLRRDRSQCLRVRQCPHCGVVSAGTVGPLGASSGMAVSSMHASISVRPRRPVLAARQLCGPGHCSDDFLRKKCYNREKRFCENKTEDTLTRCN